MCIVRPFQALTILNVRFKQFGILHCVFMGYFNLDAVREILGEKKKLNFACLMHLEVRSDKIEQKAVVRNFDCVIA